MFRIVIGVMKANDRSLISVVPVTKVAMKARMIATRNNSSKPTAVLILMLSDSLTVFNFIHSLHQLIVEYSLIKVQQITEIKKSALPIFGNDKHMYIKLTFLV